MGSSDFGDLQGFLPRFRVRSLLPEAQLPSVSRHAAAVLFVDVSGFTSLTDEAVRSGTLGTEQLAMLVDRYLGRIAEITESSGGEIVCFAGDAAWSVWFARDGLAIDAATLYAARAAIEVFRYMPEGSDQAPRIRLRASIGVGDLHHFEIGGHRDEWHALLAGDAINDVASADADGEPDRVIASGAAWSLIRGSCTSTQLQSGCVRLLSVDAEMGPPTELPNPSGLALDRLRANVPPMILNRLDVGIPVSQAGAFRTISSVFIAVEGVRPSDPDALARLQSALLAIQEICDRFGGCVHQTRTDEKGTIVILAFGLPPNHHENDATRAVRAAVSLQAALKQLGLPCSIGVASGPVFCSVIRGGERRQFALLGHAMNIAARLMEMGDGVLADNETVELARRHGGFETRSRSPTVLRGRANPLEFFSVFDTSSIEVSAVPSHEYGLVGRVQELAVLREAVDRLRIKAGSVIIVEGDAGVGKTALTSSAVSMARESGVRCLAGRADEIERETPYHPWRAIVSDIVRADQTGVSASVQDFLLEFVGDRSLVPSAGPIGSFDYLGDPSPARLSDQGRASVTRQALLDLFSLLAAKRPTLLLLEDIHWLDASSWEVLYRIAEAGLPLLLVVTARAMIPREERFERLAQSRGCLTIKLGNLSVEETARLVAKVLQVDAVGPGVGEFVHTRTQGNPLFAEQLTKLIADNGIVGINLGTATLSNSLQTAGTRLDDLLREHGVPRTLERVVLSRLDSLPPELQIAIQAASVASGTLDRKTLDAAVLASGADPTLVPKLDAFLQSAILVSDVPEREPTFEFRHTVLRDVAYNSMSHSSRVTIHRAVARTIEGSREGREGRADSVIAYHYKMAGDLRKAAKYLAVAGQKAIRVYANSEAEALLSEALGIANADQDERIRGRNLLGGMSLGEVELALGKACMGLSKYEETRLHNENGLRSHGFALPRTVAGVTMALVHELSRQFIHRRFSRYFLGRQMSRRQALLDAAAATEDLVESYFFLGEGVRSVLGALRMVNLAELAGYSPQLARGYAALATLASFVQMRGVARSYATRALELAAEQDDAAASAYVFMVVGILSWSLGDWVAAGRLLREGEQITATIKDTKRWRDFKETQGQIAGCRGEWNAALELVAAMRSSAETERDQRYRVSALREQAYFLLQLGELDEADRCLSLIRVELERGLTADADATTQDLHGIAATLAWERGDKEASIREADAALSVMENSTVNVSMPSMYWSSFLVARIYLNLWHATRNSDGGAARFASNRAKRSCRALASHARAHPIAKPAAMLAAGALNQLRGKKRVAARKLRTALRIGRELEMRYEVALAENALLGLGIGSGQVVAVPGLAFLPQGTTLTASRFLGPAHPGQ